MQHDTDVVILGGGLAGLTLALQLRQQDPTLRIVVLERRAHPVREAAFKVGESTVEIGAHYLGSVLDLREHLDSAQLRKFGFRFFFSEGSLAIGGCTELGVSRLLPTMSWQIDRGRFENFLGERALGRDIDFRDETVVRGIDFGSGESPHTIMFERDGERQALSARWVVDASGRAGLVKRKLDLARQNDHDANAVWWRVDGRHRPQRLVRGSGVAAALHSTGPLALDQPHVRPGLLGLADPAGIERAFAWHRLRRQDASAGNDEHARQGDGLAARTPAAGRRVAAATRARPAGLRLPAQFLLRLQAGFLRRPLGADRRGRAVPGSVLLAGDGLHRHLQHLHLRPGREGSRRRVIRAPRRAYTSSCISRSTKIP